MNKPRVTPNSLDTNELIELLENNEEKEVEPIIYRNDVLAFISTFKLEPGEDNIKNHTLYSIYKVWSKDPIIKNSFYQEFTKFFECKNGQYKINQNAIKLTHAAFSKFKQENFRLKSKAWAKHFEDFTLMYALKSDGFWVEAPILYFIYDKYTHERGLDTGPASCMSREVFYRYADLFFKYKNTKDGKIYSVSENITNQFQDGQLARMRKTHVQDKKKKEKSKKRRRKS